MATRESDTAALAGADQRHGDEANRPQTVDNSKRGVSIRINTSDCARVKTIAQRLRVRDSEVFRYLIHRGLKELAPLFQGDVRGHEILAMLARNGTDLIDHFNLDPERISEVVGHHGRDNGHSIDKDDIELLSMIAMPPQYLAFRLSELTNTQVSTGEVRDVLRRYLDGKYGPHESDSARVSG